MNDVARVSAECTKECSITIHDDEPKLLIRLEQFGKCLGMELVVTKIQGGVDWLEGLEIDIDLPLFAFRRQDFTTVYDQSIRWNLVVKLKPLLCGCDGRQNRLTIDS